MSETTCFGCVYFALSHNPNLPYLCRFFGFQSRNIPARDVLSTSGSQCAHRHNRSHIDQLSKSTHPMGNQS